MSDKIVGSGFVLARDRDTGTSTAYVDLKRYGSLEAGREQISQYLKMLGISVDGVQFKEISELKR